MAFTAEYWGKRAVVCRAVDGSTGCSVIQEFGSFPTWTEARNFAEKLNEGLGLSPADAHEIVTAAQLAASHLPQAPVRQTCFRDRSPVLMKARALQTRCISSQLQLARTYCRLARSRPAGHAKLLREMATRAVDLALLSLPSVIMNRNEADEFVFLIERVETELAGISKAASS